MQLLAFMQYLGLCGYVCFTATAERKQELALLRHGKSSLWCLTSVEVYKVVNTC